MPSKEEGMRKRDVEIIVGEKALEVIRRLATEPASYRLDLLYDEEKRQVRLQGDKKGLEFLIDIIRSLASDNAFIGKHEHLFDSFGLGRGDLELIIERVEPYASETDASK